MADSLLTQELAASRTPSRPNGWTTFEAAIELLSKSYLGTGLPYNADSYTVAYIGSTNNISSITFTRDGVDTKLRTFSYASSGAADDDLVVSSVDTDI